MNRLRVSMLVVGVCLLMGVQVQGQTQIRGGVRSVDAATNASRSVEPDSPASRSTVAAGAQAIVPRLMRFSGALRDTSGKPESGAVDVTFALYSTEAGGNPLWFETQSVQADELGRYTALLGAMHTEGLPLDLFTSGEVRWLGIQVGVEAEQQPRVLLVSVPYALKAGDAETLGGKPASAYMLSEPQSASALAGGTAPASGSLQTSGPGGKQTKNRTANTSPQVVCAGITSSGAATANYLSKFTTACNIEPSGIVESGGNVGIGTATPARRLTLVDNVSKVQFELQSSSASTGPNLFLNNVGATNGGKFIRSFNGNLQVLNSGYTAVLLNIQDGGNVGIGTTGPPLGKLEVMTNDTTSIGTGLRVVNTNAGSTGPNIFLRAANRSWTITGTGPVSSSGDQKFVVRDYNAAADRLVINSSGNVGVGTTTPAAKLEVSGNSQFDGPLTVTGTNSITGYGATFTGAGGGVFGQDSGVGGNGVIGSAPNATGPGIGVRGVTAADNGAAMYADATSLTGLTNGLRARSHSTGGLGVFAEALALTGTTYGVQGNSSSISGTGVFGNAFATSGSTIGVKGFVASSDGVGVNGISNAATGGTGVSGVTNATSGGSGVYGKASNSTSNGVYGINDGTGSGGTGVTGQANATGGTGTSGISTAATGFATGLYGQAASASATAAMLNNTASGNIIIGQAGGVNKFRVDGTGKGFFDGGTATTGADFAESMAVRGKRSLYEPGDLLVIDPTGHRRLAISRTPYSSHVAGIFSTKPGVLASPHTMDDDRLKEEVPLAIVGIVPCKVTAQNGPIEVGDMLVSSSLAGYAMKGIDRSRMLGAVVGKALEPLAKGKGVIQVLVTLQ